MTSNDLKYLCCSIEGRSVLYNIIDNSGVFRDTFDSDPITHAYNAGRRSIGVNLLDQIKAELHDEYIQMLREHNDGR